MSISNLVESDPKPVNLEDVEKSLASSAAARTATEEGSSENKDTPVQPAAEDTSNAIPEKLRGKSAEELAEMYVNLEQSHGRMANDLGLQRKYTDALLDLKREGDLASAPAAQPEPEPASIDATELLTDPTKAIDAYLQSKLGQLEQKSEQKSVEIEQQLAAQQFVAAHPDAEQIGQSPEFLNWANATAYRQSLAQRVQSGDYQAAHMLLDEYKASTPASQPAADASPTPADTARAAADAASAASLEGSADSSGAGSEGKGRIYKRYELQELKLRRPELYEREDFQQEILRAYAEGRVK